jgi:AraC-like DNA-binding protein
MSFLEIDKKERTGEWSMSDLQSHDYYELYFLLQGERQFYLKDKVFQISAPTVCIIPPFCMHKTAGNAYTRINVNASTDLFNSSEKAFLDELSKTVVFRLNGEKTSVLRAVLEQAAQTSTFPSDDGVPQAFLRVILHLLHQVEVIPTNADDERKAGKDETTVMKVAGYIHNHYQDEFTIEDLCAHFFISKNTLCSQFRKFAHCSIMQYKQFIRMSKAKELLAHTKKKIEEIAEECGFSSANYFSLIFKKEVGLSPANYRKTK